VGVDHGGDDIGMSQQFLHRSDVITRFKKMRGKELVLSLSKEVAHGERSGRTLFSSVHARYVSQKPLRPLELGISMISTLETL